MTEVCLGLSIYKVYSEYNAIEIFQYVISFFINVLFLNNVQNFITKKSMENILSKGLQCITK